MGQRFDKCFGRPISIDWSIFDDIVFAYTYISLGHSVNCICPCHNRAYFCKSQIKLKRMQLIDIDLDLV